MKLTVKLPLIVVVTTLITAITGSALAIYVGRQVLREDALVDSTYRARIYASAVEFYVASARAVIGTTAKEPELESAAGARRIAANILAESPVFEYVALIGGDGTVKMLEPRALEERLSHRNLAFSGWFVELLGSAESVVSDLHISPATQRPTVVIAAPVRDAEGRVRAVWSGALKLHALSEIGGAERGGGHAGASGYVTDRRGLILAHEAERRFVEQQTDFSTIPSVRAALKGSSGSAEVFNAIEGTHTLSAYRLLPATGWAVVHRVPTAVALEPLDTLTYGIGISSLALAALIGAAVLAIARRAATPLAQLATAAKTIGTGDFSRRLRAAGGDEIGELAAEFNRMADSLAEKDAQVRARAAELEASNRQLEASNRELEAFSYSVSHDLRAPLRAMNGFSVTLLEDYGGRLDAEGRDSLERIQAASQRMGALIDDLLRLSRIGRAEMWLSTVDLSAMAREIADSLNATQPQWPVDWQIAPGMAVRADAELLRIALRNLMDNAWKFTGKTARPVIRVGVREGEKAPTCFVADNGAGFDMAHAGKLFGAFQRLHHQSEFPGTGIGLAIAARIVRRHGGEIHAEAHPGQGATFSFTLGQALESGHG